MEYIYYIIASIGAGIGTGLAGLSAATVMVPILIVLCPSFHGLTGAYQATAIALASDILGSAVTTWTYAKNKNIDLKRGWILFVCIICMCTIGSFVAWLAGNVVLGSFTLFLTFFIGIRFLIKPDTTKENTVDKGQKLDWKGVLISLFFGLTIGFGTGFVGTGGGMMMLVVFTAFLGMELKMAVGTSTFIMTFTALIASISHIFIHPIILLERWNVLLVCISVTTIASLLSARFANRVNNRIVGLCTGAVLTILGACMLILNYWSFLSKYVLVVETFSCMIKLIGFIIPCVIVLLVVRLTIHPKQYVFRKLLHAIAFTCVTFMISVAQNWMAASLTSILIAVFIYPILALLENETWFSSLFVQKKKGEIKVSLLMLFFTIAIIIAVSWGIFDKMYIAVVSILMWGCGDAAAALIGIPFGKHKVNWKICDGKKSWEGTIGMFFVAVTCGMLVLLYYKKAFFSSLIKVCISALIGSAVELVSPSELDTVTVPSSILFIFIILEKII